MTTYIGPHILTREESELYQDVVELRNCAEIASVGLTQDPSKPAESFDIVVDDLGIGIYYNRDGEQEEFLYLEIPSRSGHALFRAILDYIRLEDNWIHFELFQWNNWKSLFLDYGFKLG